MTRLILSAACLAMMPMAGFAQSEDPVPANTKDRDETYLMSVDDLDVVNADGDVIGEIEDVLIDQTGRPVAFVIEVGGFLDIGDSDAQVPIDALTFADGVFVSKMTEEQLENLPEWNDRLD